MDIKDAAADYRRRGYRIVWLRTFTVNGERKQKPCRRGWRNASEEPDQYEDGNVLALQTGHNGHVIVDLDAARAIKLAETILPPTPAVEGRPSRPRSHWHYRVTNIPEWARCKLADSTGEPATKSFKTNDGEILSFRGLGSYAVVPPSAHHSGELREWQPGGELPEIDYLDLWDAVLKIVAECGYKLRPEHRGEAKRPVGRPRTRPNPPRDVVSPSSSTVDAVELARAWFVKHAPAIEGQRGELRTFVAARWLVNDFALSVDDAWPIFAEWNQHCVPPWPEDKLRGILQRAADTPEDPNYPRGRKLSPPCAWNDPTRLARDFMAEEIWRLWNDFYYFYTGTHYEKTDAGALDRALWRFVDGAAEDVGVWLRRQDPDAIKPKINRTLIANVRDALDAMIEVSPKIQMPSMLGATRSPNLLAVQNGLLDLDTLAVRPHTSDWFSCSCLSVDYKADAECPRWLETLATLLEDDRKRIDLLQEWAGYVLWRGFHAQKFLLVNGEAGTGKSVVLRVLLSLLGDDNHVALNFPVNGEDRFLYASTFGKMLAYSSDTSRIDKMAEGPFKSFVAGDPMSFEEKHVPAFTAKPTAKLMIVANEMPRFSDRSEGVWRRILHLPMNYVVPESDRNADMEDVDFWRDDLPGILVWAVAGLTRLRKQHWRFATPEAGLLVAAEHRKDCDSARCFLSDHFRADPACLKPVPMSSLYHAYQAWCYANGVKYPVGMRVFCRTVRAVFPTLDSVKERVGDQKIVAACWLGLVQFQGFDGVTSSRVSSWIAEQA